MKAEEFQLEGALNYWHNEKLGIMYQMRKIDFAAQMEGRERTEEENQEVRRLLSEADKVQVKINEAQENLYQYYIERYETTNPK
jgi:hypothetical protein